jgi:hypothetical protein
MGSDPPLPKGLLQRVIDLRAFERPPTAAITLDEMYTHTMVHSATTKVLDINLYRQSRSLPPELRLLQRNRRPPACSRTRQTTMSPESWLTSSLANHPIFTLPAWPSSRAQGDHDGRPRRRPPRRCWVSNQDVQSLRGKVWSWEGRDVGSLQGAFAACGQSRTLGRAEDGRRVRDDARSLPSSMPFRALKLITLDACKLP